MCYMYMYAQQNQHCDLMFSNCTMLTYNMNYVLFTTLVHTLCTSMLILFSAHTYTCIF